MINEVPYEDLANTITVSDCDPGYCDYPGCCDYDYQDHLALHLIASLLLVVLSMTFLGPWLYYLILRLLYGRGLEDEPPLFAWARLPDSPNDDSDPDENSEGNYNHNPSGKEDEKPTEDKEKSSEDKDASSTDPKASEDPKESEDQQSNEGPRDSDNPDGKSDHKPRGRLTRGYAMQLQNSQSSVEMLKDFRRTMTLQATSPMGRIAT